MEITDTKIFSMKSAIEYAMIHSAIDTCELGFLYDVDTGDLLQNIEKGEKMAIYLNPIKIQNKKIGLFHTHPYGADYFFSLWDFINLKDLTELKIGIVESNVIYTFNLENIDRLELYDALLKMYGEISEEKKLIRVQRELCTVCENHSCEVPKLNRLTCNKYSKYEKLIKIEINRNKRLIQSFSIRFNITKMKVTFDEKKN